MKLGITCATCRLYSATCAYTVNEVLYVFFVIMRFRDFIVVQYFTLKTKKKLHLHIAKGFDLTHETATHSILEGRQNPI